MFGRSTYTNWDVEGCLRFIGLLLALAISLLVVVEALLRYAVPAPWDFSAEILPLIIPIVFCLTGASVLLGDCVRKFDSKIRVGLAFVLLLVLALCVLEWSLGVARQSEVTVIRRIPIWPAWLVGSAFLIFTVAIALFRLKNWGLLALVTSAIAFAGALAMPIDHIWPILALLIVIMLYFRGENPSTVLFLAGLFGALVEFDSLNSAILFSASKINTIAESRTLTSVPLFVASGAILARTNWLVSWFDYRTSRQMISGLRRSIAVLMSSVVASTMSGSSIATTAVATKLVERTKNFSRLTEHQQAWLGAVAAAGGTLGMLIPPSAMIIIVAAVVGVSFRDLALVMLPFGALSIGMYILTVRCFCPLFSKEDIAGESFESKRAGINGYVPFLACLVSVIIVYNGLLSPVEFACVLLLASTAICVLETPKGSRFYALYAALSDGGYSFGNISILIVGGQIFAGTLAISDLNFFFANFVEANVPDKQLLVIALAVTVLAFGSIVDPITLLFVIFPLFSPMIDAMELNKLLVAALFLVGSEAAMITPPLGLNLNTVRISLPQIRYGALVRNIMPFVATDVLRVGLITLLLVS